MIQLHGTADTVKTLFFHQHGSNRRIHTAGEAQHDAAVFADPFANGSNRLIDERRHRPVSRAAANLIQEILKDHLAFFAVRHLRMELHTVDALLGIRHRAERTVLAVRNGRKALRRFGDVIGVAHPHDGFPLHAGAERTARVKGDRHAAILALGCLFDCAAQRVCRQLHAIADAQNRNAQRIKRRVDMRRVGVEHRGRAAGKDDANGRLCADFLHRNGAGNNLTEDPGFSHASRDQLGILRAEV